MFEDAGAIAGMNPWRSLSISRYDDGSIAASVMVSQEDIVAARLAASSSIKIQPEEWVVVRIGEGQAGFNEVGVAQKVSRPLARKHISVMFVSSSNEDYVLVPSSQLGDTIACLRDHFVCEFDEDGAEVPPSSGMGQTSNSSAPKDEETFHKHALHWSSQAFSLLTIPRGMKRACTHGYMSCILKILDGAPEVDFLHLIEAEGETSVMVSADEEVTREAFGGGLWRRVRIGTDYLDLVETGIVSSTTKCLSSVGLSVVYVSTYDFDYVFVREEDFNIAHKELSRNFAVFT